jgi:hypothetical protein
MDGDALQDAFVRALKSHNRVAKNPLKFVNKRQR